MRGSSIAPLYALLAIGVLVGVVGTACGARSAPIEAYGSYPALEDVVISPNGERLAYATGDKNGRAIVVLSLTDFKPLGTIKVGSDKLRSIAWADNDRLLVTTSQTSYAQFVVAPRLEWLQCTSYNMAEKQIVRLPSNIETALNVVDSYPEVRIVNGHTVVYVAGYYFPDFTKGKRALFSIDLSDGHARVVDDTPHVLEWLIDEAGSVVAETQYNETRQHWSLKLKHGADTTEALGIDTAIDFPEMKGLSEDGRSVLVRMTGEHSNNLISISLDTGTSAPVQGPAEHFDVFILDPVSHRIIGGKTTGMSSSYTFLSSANQSLWRSVSSAFSGSNVELVSASNDLRKIVVRLSGQATGSEYELVDLNVGSAKRLGMMYAGIGADSIAPVNAVRYKASDGREIPAYLTLPLNKSAKNLALIVLPHGGPAARDVPGFDWWAQALASRGYAVLQPEFRGSDGFGWPHLAAGFGEWGRKMQSDLADGVRWLAAQGTVDSKRVCIVGGSYGGYAALAGVTLESGTYRCAVSVAGISDLGHFLTWRANQSGSSNNPESRYWQRFMGATDPHDTALEVISPLAHAGQASAPILMIHGKDDTVVPIEQSEMMSDALKKLGKDVTLTKLDGEDHWLSIAQTRILTLQAIDAFLEKNNPP